MFELLKIDFDTMGSLVEEFYHQNQKEGNPNNFSKKAMKISVFQQENWWGCFYKGKIISMSGCYQTDHFGKDGWRLLFRSATLKKYRGLAGVFSKDLNHDFCFGHLLKVQRKFVLSRGAQIMFFTTNSGLNDGYSGSLKADRVVRKALLPRGKVRLLRADHTYFFCQQNIWQVF